MQVRQARHQPFLQERRQRAHVDRAGFAFASEPLQSLLELVEPAPHAGQQLRAFGCQVNRASRAPEEGRLQIVLE